MFIQHGVPTYLQQPCNGAALEERRNGGNPARAHLQQINKTANWPNVSNASTKRSIHWSTRSAKSTHTTSATRPSTAPSETAGVQRQRTLAPLEITHQYCKSLGSGLPSPSRNHMMVEDIKKRKTLTLCYLAVGGNKKNKNKKKTKKMVTIPVPKIGSSIPPVITF
jgi:hypothetical protein